jgi:hypothetical protein
MGFRMKCGLGLVGIVVLWSAAAAALAGAEKSHVVVLVNNSAQVTPSILQQAEDEAARVFSAAGVEIEWVNCGSEAARAKCRVVPGFEEFVLHIVPSGKTSTDSVFGEAFLGEDGSGKYSDVFFNRIQEADRAWGADTGRLLGAVAAHEIGHLLLGSRAHSNAGIMEPRWREKSLRSIGMGTLLFTPEESKMMKARIGGRTLTYNSLAGGPRKGISY